MKPWSTLAAVVALVGGLAVAVPFSLKMHRAAAGTPQLEQRIEEVAARLDGKIDRDRMRDLQERMWSIERRWGEVFLAEKNYAHRTIGELLQFMPEETAKHYRELEAEYQELLEKQRAKEKERDSEDG